MAFPPGSGSQGQVVPGGIDCGEEVGTSVTSHSGSDESPQISRVS